MQGPMGSQWRGPIPRAHEAEGVVRDMLRELGEVAVAQRGCGLLHEVRQLLPHRLDLGPSRRVESDRGAPALAPFHRAQFQRDAGMKCCPPWVACSSGGMRRGRTTPMGLPRRCEEPMNCGSFFASWSPYTAWRTRRGGRCCHASPHPRFCRGILPLGTGVAPSMCAKRSETNMMVDGNGGTAPPPGGTWSWASSESRVATTPCRAYIGKRTGTANQPSTSANRPSASANRPNACVVAGMGVPGPGPLVKPSAAMKLGRPTRGAVLSLSFIWRIRIDRGGILPHPVRVSMEDPYRGGVRPCGMAARAPSHRSDSRRWCRAACAATG